MTARSGHHLDDGDRRLTARSVILSVLLGSEPPRLPTSLLVRTTALFGISDGTTRTALSRLVSSGELRAVDGRHEIASPPLLARQARQTLSRVGDVGRWDGSWHQIVVGSAARPADERAALRSTLLSARFGELRDGVWLRPANLGTRPDPGPADVQWFRTVPEAPGELAARLWDLPTWADRARSLVGRLEHLEGPLRRGDRSELARGFVVSAAVLRHLQADPLLPSDLLPPGWPGLALRDAYDRFDRAYRDLLRAWFDEHGE